MADRGSFPHPVLDASDDIASNFEVVNASAGPTQEDVEITLEVRLDDPDLAGFIERGDARHSLRWTCSSTISTGEVEPEVIKRTAGGVVLRMWVDQQHLRGETSVEVRVVASKPIAGLHWTRQHSDYGDATFDLETGDVLADGGVITFNARKLYDPLAPPVGSCFRFVADPKLRKGMFVGLDGEDDIVVRLPPKVLAGLSHLGARPDLQIAMVVLPALMETLAFMKANDASQDEVLDDRRWYVAILGMVEANGGLDKSPLELAQKILEHPVDRAVLVGIGCGRDDE